MMSTCQTMMSTCQTMMSTCQIFMLTCQNINLPYVDLSDNFVVVCCLYGVT